MSKEIRRGLDCPVFSPAGSAKIDPQPGEIWRVNFPQSCTAGHELFGVRPSVVVSDNHSHRYGLRMVVPLTGFQPSHAHSILATIIADRTDGLEKHSTAWAFNARGCDLGRFAGYDPLGMISNHELDSLRLALRAFLGS